MNIISAGIIVIDLVWLSPLTLLLFFKIFLPVEILNVTKDPVQRKVRCSHPTPFVASWCIGIRHALARLLRDHVISNVTLKQRSIRRPINTDRLMPVPPTKLYVSSTMSNILVFWRRRSSPLTVSVCSSERSVSGLYRYRITAIFCEIRKSN